MAGIQEHIDLGIKYDPGIGSEYNAAQSATMVGNADCSFCAVFGMDFYVSRIFYTTPWTNAGRMALRSPDDDESGSTCLLGHAAATPTQASANWVTPRLTECNLPAGHHGPPWRSRRTTQALQGSRWRTSPRHQGAIHVMVQATRASSFVVSATRAMLMRFLISQFDGILTNRK